MTKAGRFTELFLYEKSYVAKTMAKTYQGYSYLEMYEWFAEQLVDGDQEIHDPAIFVRILESCGWVPVEVTA